MIWSLGAQFINPDVSRSGLDRFLRRHGVTNLRVNYKPRRWLMPARLSHRSKPSRIRPGFLHGYQVLARGCLTKQRRYLFVAIDRATRWVFMHIYADQKVSKAAWTFKPAGTRGADEDRQVAY